MVNKCYSKEQLKSLLQTISDDIFTLLRSSNDQNHQYFYQNFTTLSMKALKYLSQYLNQVSSDHTFGRAIDELVKGFSDSIQDYKGRDIFLHSSHTEMHEHSREEDEIYHFMNTRNNLLPIQCLGNDENQRQRKQLQEFVQEMDKQTLSRHHIKESKRSLLLPKDNNFLLKIGRKTTYDVPQTRDPELFDSQLPVETLLIPVISENVQTQTEFTENNEEFLQQPKKEDFEIGSQCQSFLPSQATVSMISMNKMKAPSSSKKREKKKGNGLLDSRGKKKAKFNNSNPALVKQTETSKAKEQLKKKKEMQSNQCSLKLVKTNDPYLSLCSKEVDLFLFNTEEVTIAINYINCNESKKEEPDSIPIICEISEENNSNHRLSNDNQFQQGFNSQSQKDTNIQYSLDGIKSSQFSMSRTQSIEKQQQSQTLHRNSYLRKNSKSKLLNSNTIYSSIEMQKIPTSGVRILENSYNSQTEQHTSIHKKEDQNSFYADPYRGGNIKRKRFTGERYLFQSFYPIEAQVETLDKSENLNVRTSKIHLQPHMFKRESNRAEVRSSFIKEKFDTESVDTPSSQDYLVSRSKAEPIELINKLLEIQQNGSSVDSDPVENSKESCAMIRSSLSIIGKERFGTELMNEKDNHMIVISNRKSIIHEQPHRFKSDSRNIFENDLILSTVGKENASQLKEVKEGKVKHSFLKRNNLSSITEVMVSQDSNCSSLIRQNSIKNFRSKEFKIGGLSPSANPSNKSHFYRESVSSPKRVAISKLKNEFKSQSSQKSANRDDSASFHTGGIEMLELKRKLRNRTYQSKLSSYLELIQATHQKFCGAGCIHLQQLLKAKQGSIPNQILRLFSRLN